MPFSHDWRLHNMLNRSTLMPPQIIFNLKESKLSVQHWLTAGSLLLPHGQRQLCALSACSLANQFCILFATCGTYDSVCD